MADSPTSTPIKRAEGCCNSTVRPSPDTRYRVAGIPNFAVFRGGRLVSQQAGAIRQPALEALAMAAA